MIKRLLLLSLPLAACTTYGERAESGRCPAGEACSPRTPYGLHFLGTRLADDVANHGPMATAVGGTQDIELEEEDSFGTIGTFTATYDADDDGGLGVQVVSHQSATVTVKGMEARSNYLRIIDPATGELYDRYSINGAAIAEMHLVGAGLDSVPAGADLVFGPGVQEVGVALLGDVQAGGGPVRERVVDTSMKLELSGAARTGWDKLTLDVTPGTYPVTVTAGDRPPTQLALEVVAGADAIAALGPSVTVGPNGGTIVCFAATNAGRYVYGLAWAFTVAGEPTPAWSDQTRNCVPVIADHASGSIAVIASAGGVQTELDVPVAQALAPVRETRRAIGTAGERAAL